MSRYALIRLLEAFFRRWYLCLLPLVLLVGFGVANVRKSTKDFRSTGVVYVENSSFVAQLTSVRSDSTNTFQSPASIASQKINGLLQTDEFVRTVATKAGFTVDASNEGVLLPATRKGLSAYPAADNLVRIGATNADPNTAYKLAQATIDGFVQWITDANITESKAAQQFFDEQLPTYKDTLDTARRALADYVVKHPGPAAGERPLAEQIEITRLNSEVDQAQTRYTNAVTKSEEARLASAQTTSDVAGRFRLVDAPQIPTAPQSGLKKTVMQVAMFAVLGLMLSAAAAFAGLMTDRSVHLVPDLSERLGAPVLAVLPDVE